MQQVLSEKNHYGVEVDIITSTLGKALGGATGGFTSGKKEIIDYLRQRSRPYLFSNTLAPMVTGASLAVLDIIEQSSELRDNLNKNIKYFRDNIHKIGLDIKPGTTPIIPVMIYDAKLANEFAKELLEQGIYAVGFYYPIVPKGQARIRLQISAAHTQEHLDKALEAFDKISHKLGMR